MSNSLRALPPLASRHAAGRPVMTREQLLAIGQRVLRMTTVKGVDISVTHTARIVTRIANDRILTSDDGDTLMIRIVHSLQDHWPPVFLLETNQLDDRVILAGVQQCEALLRAGGYEPTDQVAKTAMTSLDTPLAVQLWHEPTVQAMTTTRSTVIPDMIDAVTQKQLRAAGFLGLMARAEAMITKGDGITYFSEETDSEVTVTARDRTGKSSGWSGHAARDWSTINVSQMVHHATDMATRAGPPVALEPGRRTAILTPAAVIQFLRYFAGQLDARMTDMGYTALSKVRGQGQGNKLRQRVLDPRLMMSSSPADLDGGYRPFYDENGRLVATPAMTWVENGVLKNLAYSIDYAMERGKAYAQSPMSLRLSGGTTSIDQMIAQCKDGILVNRVSDVDMIDETTCVTTGVTRDGCFHIKDGKIVKAVKNFRFLESPFFFLNRIEALGVPERAAFGYTPKDRAERWWDGDWPRPPIIAPPMMVRDFNFVALADAV